MALFLASLPYDLTQHSNSKMYLFLSRYQTTSEVLSLGWLSVLDLYVQVCTYIQVLDLAYHQQYAKDYSTKKDWAADKKPVWS